MLYLGIIAITAILAFSVLIDDTPNINTPVANLQPPVAKKPTPPTQKKEINIIYEEDSQQNSKKKVAPTNNKPPAQKPVATTTATVTTKKKSNRYELINTGKTVGNYYVNVVSSRPIPPRDPRQFPQIPASIQGSIDGQKFSMVIPSDLRVKDFKVRIKNEKTGKAYFVNLQEEHLKPGTSSELIVDTNNPENFVLRSNSIPAPPAPPPPLPK